MDARVIYLDSHTSMTPLDASFDEARLRHLLAIDEGHFQFPASGQEAIGAVFQAVLEEKVIEEGKTHIIVFAPEEAAALLFSRRAEKFGAHIKVLPVDKTGKVDLAVLEEALSVRTALVSLSWANGLTGVIQPVEEIAALCKERGVSLHVDGTYAVGKLYFQLRHIPLDYFSLRGAVLGAPPCSALLWSKEKIDPLVLGNPQTLSLVDALEKRIEEFETMCIEVIQLRDHLEEALMGEVYFKEEARLPNVTAIAFPDVVADALLFYLKEEGVIATQGGKYCQTLNAQLKDPSAISFALSIETTKEEIDQAIKIINSAVKKLQKIGAGA